VPDGLQHATRSADPSRVDAGCAECRVVWTARGVLLTPAAWCAPQGSLAQKAKMAEDARRKKEMADKIKAGKK